MKQDLRDRAADVRELLHAHMPQARQMLRTLLDGKLLAEPLVEEGRYGYRLTGNLNIGRLLKAEV